VHISAMANTYVSDPRKIATPGEVVRVKVLEVDPKRRRISLTMRLDDTPGDRATAARPAIAAHRDQRNASDPPRHVQRKAISCPPAVEWPKHFGEQGRWVRFRVGDNQKCGSGPSCPITGK